MDARAWEGRQMRSISRLRALGATLAATALATTALVPLMVAAPQASAATATWVDGWAAAPHSSAAETTVPTFTNRTLRMVVRLHASGTSVRIRLANSFGDRAVTFGRVTVGRRVADAAVASGTLRAVPFAGQTSVTVAAGAEVSSDPVGLTVTTGQDLLVSIYVPRATGPATWHRSALQTSYLSTSGDHARDTGTGAYGATTNHWFFLDAVNVLSTTAPGTVVAIGDSITDGSHSTSNANRRWPDILATRLAAQPGPAGTSAESVVNEGIAGNKVLTDTTRNGVSLLHRVTRDLLQRRGLRHVILLEGVNDLRSSSPPATAAQIIAGYQQVIDRLHARQVKVYGATLTPIEGSGGYSAAMERERQALNTWIRTSGAFDGVVDFDKATRDPADPLRFRPAFDSGDHLHPNDAGYRAMGESIDLRLFTTV
jgi:lysophospholipase L1-like esterase